MSADAPIFYGLRGVGKTVLLKALHNQAEHAGWLTVEIEGKQESAEQDLTRQRLARGLITAARSVAPRESLSEKWTRALSTISSFSLAAGTSGVELSIGVEPAHEVAVTRAIRPWIWKSWSGTSYPHSTSRRSVSRSSSTRSRTSIPRR